MDLLEQELVSGSGTRRAICKSAPRPRQMLVLLPNQQRQSTEGGLSITLIVD